MDDIANWLTGLGLPQYIALFAEHDIDFAVIRDLKEADLKELGISLGHRRKLLRAAGDIDSAEPPVSEDRAERRQLTVMFSDLAGSTALAAQLDPEDMREVILAYQQACAGVVRAYGGFLAKYMGDGILIYFGYPRAREDDAERAVRAGLDIIAAVAKLKIPGDTAAQVRIGIATGPVIVGDVIGEGVARERAVVGEPPNLAARLQGLAAPGSMVIAAATRRLLGTLFHLRDLGRHELKGYAEPLTAWAVEGEAAVSSRFEATRSAGLTGFIGREEQIDTLLTLKERAWRGEGQVVLISGEAGIGKSRLAAWLADRLAPEPHRLLRYQCSAYHTNSALNPFIRQLRSAAGFEPADRPDQLLDKLEALIAHATPQSSAALPLFAALLSIPADERHQPLDVTAAVKRRLTLDALLDQVEGFARQEPVLLLFEDAHWADTTSRELLELAVDRVRDLPALLVVTSRPEFQPAWGDRANVATLKLERLDQRQAREIVHWLTGGRDLPPGVLQSILAKTDGVPLFVEELTKSLLESGQLEEVAGLYRLAGSVVELAIPATLQDSLMARLDRLDTIGHVAQVGAAIGRSFTYQMVALVTGLDEAKVTAALEKLVEAELIFQKGTGWDARYTFKHALVQDAAYERLLRSDRQTLHGRIVDIFETRFPARIELEPEVLAEHCVRGRLHEKAVAYWLQAARRSLQRLHLAETVTQLQAALTLLVTQPQTSARDSQELSCQFLLAQAQVHAKGYGSAETMAAWTRAQSLAGQVGTAEQQFSINYGLWVGQYAQGNLSATTALAEECLRTARLLGNKTQLCVAERITGAVHFGSGEFIFAQKHFARAIDFYDEPLHSKLVNDLAQDLLVAALSYKALVLWPLGYPDQAGAAIEAVLSHAKKLNHAPSLAFAYWHAGVMGLLMLRDDALLARHVDAFIDLAIKHELSWWVYGGRVTQGWLQALAGADLASVRETEAILETMRMRTGTRIYETVFFALLGEAQAAAGDIPAGLASIAEGIKLAETTGLVFWLAELYRLRGAIAGRSEAHRQEAEPALRQAIEIARHQNAASWELRAGTDLASLLAGEGKADEAYHLLEPIYRGFTEGFETRDLCKARALIDELAGRRRKVGSAS